MLPQTRFAAQDPGPLSAQDADDESISIEKIVEPQTAPQASTFPRGTGRKCHHPLPGFAPHAIGNVQP
jgi:hypothetical protein